MLKNNLQDKMVDYYTSDGVGYAEKISRDACRLIKIPDILYINNQQKRW